MKPLWKPKERLPEECRCPCHDALRGQPIVHCAPCCKGCPQCGRAIGAHLMDEHIATRHSQITEKSQDE